MEKNSTRWLSMLVGGAVVGVLALTVLALTDGGPSSANGSDGRTQQTDPQTAVTKLRSVTVQGHGSVKATPDTVVVDIGVQTQAPHANDALEGGQHQDAGAARHVEGERGVARSTSRRRACR